MSACQSTTIVVFGITGDLAHRKLIPALYYLHANSLLPEDFSIIGVGRRSISRESLLREFKKNIPARELSSRRWHTFAGRFSFLKGDVADSALYRELSRRLADLKRSSHCQNILYYLVVSSFYGYVAKNLSVCHLTSGCVRHGSFTRLVIEKPFGADLESSRALNRVLRRCFREEQIFRIDHYLGKETVQNILTFRFANDIFSPLWSREGVDHVQITAAESIGIENRGAYFDATGALRDMAQNHLLQVLAHVAMEEPRLFSSGAVRDARLRVLASLRPIPARDMRASTVRGQYAAEKSANKNIIPYRKEASVSPRSATETFAALKLFIENDRWRGVPFYLRTGKRLQEKFTEIAVQFKERSEHLFHGYPGDEPNAIFFRIQPDESITIRFTVKKPGLVQEVKTADTTLCYSSFTARQHDAYERLLLDALSGDQTLFTRTDEVEAQWRFITPIAEAWRDGRLPRLEAYAAGSWGPAGAARLIERDGRTWYPYKPGICTPLTT